MAVFRRIQEENSLSGKKKLLMVLIILLMLASIAAGLIWHMMHYTMIGFQFYAKDSQTLDLREEEISVSHYEKLSRQLPDCEILWSVPFQGGLLSSDTREITITSLTDSDVAALDYLTELEAVNAEQCTDYAQLQQLRTSRPELQVVYNVVFSDGTTYPHGAEEITLSKATAEDVPLLQYLPALKRVVVSGGRDMQNMDALRGNAHNLGAEFGVLLDGKVVSDLEKTVVVDGITDDEVNLLQLLVSMETLHLTNPEAAAQTVLSLRDTYPQVKISWQQDIGGVAFQDTVTEVDLSAVVIEDLAEVEAKMAYLPNAELLIFGLCGIDNPDWGASRTKNLAICEIENEDLAAYRDRVRADYKVVWTVRLGPSIALRTDKDNFMPNHFGVGRLFNDYAYNLRYCEDMVCLDIGHMTLTDISFVEFMPKLKYLILAWTEVQYIEPIRSCKNLIFLELDNSCIRDLSPLVDCTALQDLNLGNTFCDITPVCEMTWLKNLYMIFGSGGDAWKASQALPNTRVVTNGNATVGGGWRRLQNYYDMRDCLGVPYMN